MSSTLDRWHKLVELAELEVENAAKTIAFMRDQLQQTKEQLNSLNAYAEEYAQTPSNQKSIAVLQLQSHQAFGEKIYQAIQAQTARQIEQEEMVEKALEAWREKRTRLKALESLLFKKQKQRDFKLSRQEQKMLDELASQQAVQKRLNSL